jgi:hypothetical protein
MNRTLLGALRGAGDTRNSWNSDVNVPIRVAA